MGSRLGYGIGQSRDCDAYEYVCDAAGDADTDADAYAADSDTEDSDSDREGAYADGQDTYAEGSDTNRQDADAHDDSEDWRYIARSALDCADGGSCGCDSGCGCQRKTEGSVRLGIVI